MLQIEILTCEALTKAKLMPYPALARIKRKARFNINRIKVLEQKTNHDVVAFITNVSEYIGSDAKYLHRGLTSSDVLDTTLSLQLRESADIILEDLARLKIVLANKARQYKNTACIGRTHGIHAEPITLGLKFASWFDEINRQIIRVKQARQAICLVKLSGAVGTYSHLPPKIESYVAFKLKLRAANIATQVISRDIYAQYVCTLALVAASLEKFAQEIRHLQRTEVREVEEPFTPGQKGSSAMPHKRNPVICERICGLARIIRANSLASLENISLWHERDISHSSVERVILPDSCQVLDYMLVQFTKVLNNLLVYPDKMLENIAKTRGLIFSQRILVKLMEKGVARTQAYDIVQKVSMRVWRETTESLMDCLIKDKEARKFLSEKEIKDCFNLSYYLRNVSVIFNNVGL
jgi:adenylosuccinate lyase